MTVLNTTRASTKTVVILGAAYAGRRCAQVLGSTLPPDWRVVVIDRNTHFNHVYVFPRFTVLSSHANKAFVPYTHAFQPRPGDTLSPAGLPTPPTTPTEEGESLTQKLRVWIHGNVSSLSSHSVTYTRLSSDDPDRPVGGVESVEFDYMIYALGASLPSPVDVWGSEASGLSIHGVPMGCKRRGVEYMERRAETMKRAKSVLVVGGGALELATDLKDVYPEKEVTLVHSRPRLMPIYPVEMHNGILESLEKLGVNVVLGERVMQWPEHPEILDGHLKALVTSAGRTLTAEMVLPCTGQKPHVAPMAAFCPQLISPTSGRIRIHPSLQVNNSLPGMEGAEDLSHIFACGDCAESGAIQAGHTAYWQGQQAAENIVKMIALRDGMAEGPLGEYKPTPPAIKVTLGRENGIISNAEGTKRTEQGVEDLSAPIMWDSHNVQHLPYTA